ncbi:hypothetical protein [uncultured Brevundimonas sp.]|uniref:hypothetical protein n=1 Tax=uncultured Brevundimonas sp. TaxID=213418 RepID=UPI0026207B37|nr:hypothetical protein [uncultured Brevundimonas sp.]
MAQRRGLFGGFNPLRFTGQPNDKMMMLGAALSSVGNGGDPRGMFAVGQMAAARRADEQAQQALRERTALEDRQRALLSPSDGPNGSGTGPAPSLQEMQARQDEVRLLNPEVAATFDPYVQSREREQNAASLFSDDPKAAMLYRAGNQSFLDSLGAQYKPQVIGAGGRQSVYGESRTVDAPSFMQFGNHVQRNDPGTGQSITVASRTPDPVNVAPGGRLLNPETGAVVGMGASRVFSAGDGAMLFDENGNPIAENHKAPGSEKVTEGQAKDGFNAGRLERSGAIIKGLEDQNFDYGRSALTGGQMRSDFRSYEAAALEWTDAMLRMTSGAQAPESEVRAQMRTYFPQPGDSIQVRNQKAQMRRDAEEAARFRAGAGYSGGVSARQPQGGIVAISGPEEAQRLPPGTRFRTPDGRVLVRQ